MLMEWSAAAAALAFVLLAAAIVVSLRSALRKLGQLQASAEVMQQDLHRLSAELSGLVPITEDTIRSAHRQLQSVSSLFEAAGQIGGAISHTTSAVERAAGILSESALLHENRSKTKRQVGEAMEWAEIGMAAWQLWQTNRKPQTDEGSHASSSESKPTSMSIDEGHANHEGSESDVNT